MSASRGRGRGALRLPKLAADRARAREAKGTGEAARRPSARARTPPRRAGAGKREVERIRPAVRDAVGERTPPHLPSHSYPTDEPRVGIVVERDERDERLDRIDGNWPEEKRLAGNLQHERSRKKHDGGNRPPCMEKTSHSRRSAIWTRTRPDSRAMPTSRMTSPVGTRRSASSRKVPDGSAPAHMPSRSFSVATDAASESE